MRLAVFGAIRMIEYTIVAGLGNIVQRRISPDQSEHWKSLVRG